MTALAAGDNVVTATGAFSFTVASDGTIAIECQGSGAGGNALGAAFSGGGGACAVTTSIAVLAGDIVYGSVGAGGGIGTAGQDSWVNVNVNSPPSSTTTGCLAKGGSTNTGAAGGTGGQAASCIGDTTFSGGSGV